MGDTGILSIRVIGVRWARATANGSPAMGGLTGTVTSVLVDETGRLLAATAGGLFRLDDPTATAADEGAPDAGPADEDAPNADAAFDGP